MCLSDKMKNLHSVCLFILFLCVSEMAAATLHRRDDIRVSCAKVREPHIKG